MKTQRHRIHTIGKIKRAFAGALGYHIGTDPSRTVKLHGLLRPNLAHIQRHHPRIQPSRTAGIKPRVLRRLQPAHHANMVWMMMGKDKARYRQTAQRAAQNILPEGDCVLTIIPAINHAPPVPIPQGKDIHVIQCHRQGQAQPENSISDFNRFADFGGGIKGIGYWSHRLGFYFAFILFGGYV